MKVRIVAEDGRSADVEVEREPTKTELDEIAAKLFNPQPPAGLPSSGLPPSDVLGRIKSIANQFAAGAATNPMVRLIEKYYPPAWLSRKVRDRLGIGAPLEQAIANIPEPGTPESWARGAGQFIPDLALLYPAAGLGTRVARALVPRALWDRLAGASTGRLLSKEGLKVAGGRLATRGPGVATGGLAIGAAHEGAEQLLGDKPVDLPRIPIEAAKTGVSMLPLALVPPVTAPPGRHRAFQALVRNPTLDTAALLGGSSLVEGRQPGEAELKDAPGTALAFSLMNLLTGGRGLFRPKATPRTQPKGEPPEYVKSEVIPPPRLPPGTRPKPPVIDVDVVADKVADRVLRVLAKQEPEPGSRALPRVEPRKELTGPEPPKQLPRRSEVPRLPSGPDLGTPGAVAPRPPSRFNLFTKLYRKQPIEPKDFGSPEVESAYRRTLERSGYVKQPDGTWVFTEQRGEPLSMPAPKVTKPRKRVMTELRETVKSRIANNEPVEPELFTNTYQEMMMGKILAKAGYKQDSSGVWRPPALEPTPKPAAPKPVAPPPAREGEQPRGEVVREGGTVPPVPPIPRAEGAQTADTKLPSPVQPPREQKPAPPDHGIRLSPEELHDLRSELVAPYTKLIREVDNPNDPAVKAVADAISAGMKRVETARDQVEEAEKVKSDIKLRVYRLLRKHDPSVEIGDIESAMKESRRLAEERRKIYPLKPSRSEGGFIDVDAVAQGVKEIRDTLTRWASLPPKEAAVSLLEGVNKLATHAYKQGIRTIEGFINFLRNHLRDLSHELWERVKQAAVNAFRHVVEWNERMGQSGAIINPGAELLNRLPRSFQEFVNQLLRGEKALVTKAVERLSVTVPSSGLPENIRQLVPEFDVTILKVPPLTSRTQALHQILNKWNRGTTLYHSSDVVSPISLLEGKRKRPEVEKALLEYFDKIGPKGVYTLSPLYSSTAVKPEDTKYYVELLVGVGEEVLTRPEGDYPLPRRSFSHYEQFEQSQGKDVISWARGPVVNAPGIGDILVVEEIQSDLEAKVRKMKEDFTPSPDDYPNLWVRSDVLDVNVPVEEVLRRQPGQGILKFTGSPLTASYLWVPDLWVPRTLNAFRHELSIEKRPDIYRSPHPHLSMDGQRAYYEVPMKDFGEALMRITTGHGDLLAPHVYRMAAKAAVDYAKTQGLKGVMIIDSKTSVHGQGHLLYPDSLHYKVQGYTLNHDPNAWSVLRQTLATMGVNDSFIDRYFRSHPESSTDRAVLHIRRYLASIGKDPNIIQAVPRSIAGMRMYYDDEFPEIFKRLTGYPGRKIQLGRIHEITLGNIRKLRYLGVTEELLSNTHVTGLYFPVDRAPSTMRYLETDLTPEIGKEIKDRLAHLGRSGSDLSELERQIYALARTASKRDIHTLDDFRHEVNTILRHARQDILDHIARNQVIGKAWDEARRKAVSEGGFVSGDVLGELGNKLFTAFDLVKDELARTFYDPYITMPPDTRREFRRSRRLVEGAQDRLTHIIESTITRFESLDANAQQKVVDFVEGKIPLSDLPQGDRILAADIKRLWVRAGRGMVARGLMSPETFAKRTGSYSGPRLYLRYMLSQSAFAGRRKLNFYHQHRRLDDLPEEIRAELGQIRDYPTILRIGLTRQWSNIINYDYLNDLLTVPDLVFRPALVKVDGKLVGIGWAKHVRDIYRSMARLADPEVKDAVERKLNELETAVEAAEKQANAKVEGFVKIPEDRGYGILAGALMRKDAADDIIAKFQINDPGQYRTLARQIAAAERTITSIWKAAKVPLNPPTVVKNILSNPIQMVMSGQVKLFDLPEVIYQAAKSAKHKDAMYKEAMRLGVFGGTWGEVEIERILLSAAAARAKAKSEILGTIVSLASTIGSKYSLIDKFYKLAMYIQCRKNGLDRQAAADEAQKWIMNYGEASSSLRVAREHLFGVPFATYWTKILPLTIETAIKRPHILAFLMAIPGAITAATLGWKDISEAEWEDLQRSLSRYIRDGLLLLVPFKDEQGRLQVTTLDNWLPWGSWYEVAKNLTEGEYGKAAGVLGGNPLLTVATALQTGVDPATDTIIYSAIDNPSAKALKFFKWLYDVATPGFIGSRGALPETLKVLGLMEQNIYDTSLTPTQAALKWVGVNFTPLDEAGMAKQAKMFDARIREAQIGYHRRIRELTTKEGARSEDILQAQRDYARTLDKISRDLVEPSRGLSEWARRKATSLLAEPVSPTDRHETPQQPQPGSEPSERQVPQ